MEVAMSSSVESDCLLVTIPLAEYRSLIEGHERLKSAVSRANRLLSAAEVKLMKAENTISVLNEALNNEVKGNLK